MSPAAATEDEDADHVWHCGNCDSTSLSEKDTQEGAEDLGNKHANTHPACSKDDVEVRTLRTVDDRLDWFRERT